MGPSAVSRCAVVQLAQAQAQAQRVVDDAVAQSRRLHAELERAQQQGDGAAAELARAQVRLLPGMAHQFRVALSGVCFR